MALKLSLSPKPFPDLANPAIEEDVMKNKEYLNSDGGKRTGTFTIEEEVTEQNNLISQIQILLQGRSTPGTSVYFENCAVTDDGNGNVTIQ
jgi:hypothetical protein